MSSSGDTVGEKMDVCQKCGDRGEVKYLVYCNKCHVSVEHSYCMDTLPKKGKKKVVWTCEECFPRDVNPTPVPSRKSERIQGAANVKLNRMKSRKQTSFYPVKAEAYIDSSSQLKQPVTEDCCSKEAIETQPTSQCLQNEENKKSKRRLVVEDNSSSDRESEFTECLEVNPLQSALPVSSDSKNVFHSLPSSESDGHVHAKPIIDPIWKGNFIIQNFENQTSVGLVAHLSTNACLKVCEATSALPVQLNIEILSRVDAWPHKFQTTPPTDGSIGLYFFPRCERDEKFFDSVLDEMIIHDRALKAVINDLELLVFSSCELPQEHWRFRQKYYMWGLFRATKNYAVASNAVSSTPSNLTIDAGTQGGESWISHSESTQSHLSKTEVAHLI